MAPKPLSIGLVAGDTGAAEHKFLGMWSGSHIPRKIQQLAANPLPSCTHSYPHDSHSSRRRNSPALIHLHHFMATLLSGPLQSTVAWAAGCTDRSNLAKKLSCS